MNRRDRKRESQILTKVNLICGDIQRIEKSKDINGSYSDLELSRIKLDAITMGMYSLTILFSDRIEDFEKLEEMAENLLHKVKLLQPVEGL